MRSVEKLVYTRLRLVESILAAAQQREPTMEPSRLCNTALREFASGDRRRAEHKIAVLADMRQGLALALLEARLSNGADPDALRNLLDRVVAVLAVLDAPHPAFAAARPSPEAMDEAS